LIDLLPIRKVFRNLPRAHAKGAKGLQAGVKGSIVDLFGVQLQVDPPLDADRHHLLHIPGARTEGEAIKRVQGAPLVISGGARLVLFVSQQLRDRTRQAKTEKKSADLRTPHKHGIHQRKDG
jgi:hypothetical protein